MANNITQSDSTTILAFTKALVRCHDSVKTIIIQFDNGSSENFLTFTAAKELGLEGTPIAKPLQLSTVGTPNQQFRTSEFEIIILDNNGKEYALNCLGISSLADVTKVPQDSLTSAAKMFGISPKDVNNVSGKVSLLIGGDMLGIFPELVQLKENLGLYKTQFGRQYMLTGRLPNLHPEFRTISSNYADVRSREFWAIQDQIGISLQPMCSTCLKVPACKDCKNLQIPTSYKEQMEGKTVRSCMTYDFPSQKVFAKFPFIEGKDPKKIFPPEKSNQKSAIRRAENLKRSLIKDGIFEEYTDVFYEQLARGVIRKVHKDEIDSYERAGGAVNYCSHQLVIKNSSLSTRLRSVVNSSFAHNGTNLNDILCKGPNSLSNQLHVLYRFRSKPYILIGDLAKAYNQIHMVGLEEQHLRRLVWYSKDSPESICTFVMCTAAFGDRCSQFYLELSKERVGQYALEELKKPAVTDTIKYNSYVDDYLPSFDTLEEAKSVKEDVAISFSALGFKFKDIWVGGPGIKEDPRDPESVLGYTYDFNEDTIGVKFKVNFSQKRRSARTEPDMSPDTNVDDIILTPSSVLGLQMSQYDPLGLISPFMANVKILNSKICQVKSEEDQKRTKKWWGEPLDDLFQKKGRKLLKEILGAVSDPIKFPRMNCSEGYQLQQIMAFADASDICLQVILYGVYVNPNGGPKHTALLTGKNAIVHKTIPQNELMGIVASTRLIVNFLEATDPGKHLEINILTDSQVCLDMLNENYIPKDSHTAHKLSEIIKNVSIMGSNVKFWHVNSENNIADIGTKGNCKLSDLKTEKYRHGPDWMIDLENNPTIVKLRHTFNGEPTKIIANLTKVIEDENNDGFYEQLVHRISSFGRLVRVACLIRKILRKKSFKIGDTNFKKNEIYQGFLDLIRSDQKTIPIEECRTKQLTIFKEDGIYYTKQRATPETLTTIFKCEKLPVLSGKSNLSKLLIDYAHTSKIVGNLETHHGIKQTVCHTRVGTFATYITNCKQKTKYTISKCVTCKKMFKKEQMAKMDDRKGYIGTERPMDGSAFNHIAMDYFGPYKAKTPKGRDGQTRSTRHYKIWGMAILCQQTRSVAIYPVEGYDVKSFMTAFSIHCDLRGTPTSILSDPMSAFKGASKTIEKKIDINLYQKELQSTFNVDWKFIPAASQHRDPAEAQIKCIKSMMKCISSHGEQPVLSLNEYWLLFSNMAEILNRRPISAYIEEGQVKFICPNNLNMGRSSKDPPQLVSEETIDERSRVKLINDITNSFWEELQNEMCSSPHMFKTSRWYETPREPKENDIVLILYKNKISTGYRYGRVIDVINSRTLNVVVAKIQNSLPTKESVKPPDEMICPIQRTVFLYEESDLEADC